jgi:putative adhesin
MVRMKIFAVLGAFATIFPALTFASAPPRKAANAGSLPPSVEAVSVKPPVTEDVRWHGWAPAGQVVEINNIYGNVRAETAAGDEIEVIALKSGNGDPAEVSIEVIEHKGGVTICAVYPNANAEHPFECRPSHGGGFRMAASSDSEAHVRWDNGGGGDVLLNNLRVDFLVRLPRHLRFIGRTVDGDVSAHVMEQDVEAHSVLGDVTVDLDPSAGAEVRAETAMGRVSSEFPLTIRTDRDHGTQASAHFGNSHRVVRLKSSAGNIRLQRGA